MGKVTLPREVIRMIGMHACIAPFVNVSPSSEDHLMCLDSWRYRIRNLSALCLVTKMFNEIFTKELYSECNFFDNGLDFFPKISECSTLRLFSRFTLHPLQQNNIKTQQWYPFYPYVEQYMSNNLREFTFTGDFTRNDFPAELTAKFFPSLSSLRLVDMVDGGPLVPFLFNIASAITSLQIRPAASGPQNYSFSSMFATLSPLLERFDALNSLAVSLPNQLNKERICCDNGGEVLDIIHRTLPSMNSIGSLKISFPLFCCETSGDSDNHPDFWCKLLKFVSACKNLKDFSFKGNQVPITVKNKLRLPSSSIFAIAGCITIFRPRNRRGMPLSSYHIKCRRGELSDLDQRMNLEHEGQTDHADEAEYELDDDNNSWVEFLDQLDAEENGGDE
jgi:hypothetical protein